MAADGTTRTKKAGISWGAVVVRLRAFSICAGSSPGIDGRRAWLHGAAISVSANNNTLFLLNAGPYLGPVNLDRSPESHADADRSWRDWLAGGEANGAAYEEAAA